MRRVSFPVHGPLAYQMSHVPSFTAKSSLAKAPYHSSRLLTLHPKSSLCGGALFKFNPVSIVTGLYSVYGCCIH